MKNLKFLQMMILLVSLCSCDSCKDEEWTALPPETQTGANTFGCYVNGELFVKDGTHQWGYASIGAEYEKNNKVLFIHSYSKLGEIVLEISNPQKNIISSISRANFRSFSDITKCATYLGEQTGEIVLTKFDTINGIVSGRFQFIGRCELYYAPGPPDSVVSITQGRFDIKLDIYDN